MVLLNSKVKISEKGKNQEAHWIKTAKWAHWTEQQSENFREKRQKSGSPLKFIRARFRSWDLWVMGPPRFRCATLMLPFMRKSYFYIWTSDIVVQEQIICLYIDFSLVLKPSALTAEYWSYVSEDKVKVTKCNIYCYIVSSLVLKPQVLWLPAEYWSLRN